MRRKNLILLLIILMTFTIIFGCTVSEKETSNGDVSVPLVDQILQSEEKTIGTGILDDPWVINSCLELQNMDNNLDMHFILGKDIDCSDTKNWNDGNGFNPIGEYSSGRRDKLENCFKGSFDGKNHTIKGIYIRHVTNRLSNDYLGLFACSVVPLRNVNLVDLDIEGKSIIGGLVGLTTSSVENSSSTGIIKGYGTNGGLIGIANGEGTISNSHSSVTLIGKLLDGTRGNAGNDKGGLIGRSQIPIINSYATGDVKGYQRVGGLVGYSESTISKSFATGNISASSLGGGLVGLSGDIISESYATGNVTGDNTLGGLAGQSSEISNSYSTGNVTIVFEDNRNSGGYYIGGLVGSSARKIDSSYSTGEVTGYRNVGGLTGKLYGPVINSFSTSKVKNEENRRGAITGYSGDSTVFKIENFYWDPEAVNVDSCHNYYLDKEKGCFKSKNVSEYYGANGIPFSKLNWDKSIWKSTTSYPILNWQ
jgi:hypothetical protein